MVVDLKLLQPRNIVIGVVMDISIAHAPNGQRYIDDVKQALVAAQVKLDMDGIVHLAGYDGLPRHQGEAVARIANYIEAPDFRVADLLHETLQLVGAERDAERYVLLITDRYSVRSAYRFREAVSRNDIDNLGCRFVFFGVGDKYDRSFLTFAEKLPHCVVRHLDDSVFDILDMVGDGTRG